jgi:hypothetical protein
MRGPALALAVLVFCGSAHAQTVTIAANEKPTLKQAFDCAAVYAVSLQSVYRETGKPDAAMRASLRGWLVHIRDATGKANAELNAEIRPVIQSMGAELAAMENPKAASLERRKACARAEVRSAEPQAAALNGG